MKPGISAVCIEAAPELWARGRDRIHRCCKMKHSKLISLGDGATVCYFPQPEPEQQAKQPEVAGGLGETQKTKT